MNSDTLSEVASLVAEAKRLTSNPAGITRSDQARVNVLLANIALLKSGELTPDDIRRYSSNKVSLEDDGPVRLAPRNAATLTLEERLFRAHLNGDEAEKRALLTNNPALSALSPSTLGTFVPLTFFEEAIAAMAQVDPMFGFPFRIIKEPALTIKPKQLVAWDLTTISSELQPESADAPLGDFVTPPTIGRLMGGFMHRINVPASLEFEADAFRDTMSLLAEAYGVAFARGMGRQLVNGTGVNQPQGIAQFVPSSGISNATPGTIVLNDLTKIYFSINRVWRARPSCAWLMSDSVYKKVRNAQDAQGRPLLDVERDGEYLLGKRVLVSPSLETISLGTEKLIFGDCSRFYVRLSPMVINRCVEAPGFAEKGLALYQGLQRVDSWYCDASGGAVPPLNFSIIN